MSKRAAISATVECYHTTMPTITNRAALPITRIAFLLISYYLLPVAGWGSSGGNYDESAYMNGRDWASDGSSISIKVDGCAWGLTDEGENAACMEQSSEDGTTYWYQMVNCLRAQVVFSVYAGNGNCNSGSYKETFMAPLSDFISYMETYDAYTPFGQGGNGGDDDGGGNFDEDNLPICEGGEDYYYGVACADDGTFSIGLFSDQYCFEYTESTYDSLSSINSNMKSYKSSCTTLSGDDDGGGFGQNAVPYLMPCSSLDSSVCSDGSSLSSRESGSAAGRFHLSKKSGSSWSTKLKYGVGALLLLGAFILFTGILFTNRRRRRALIQRKYRASRRNRRSSRSARSKSRSDRTARSSKSKRSKSRSRARDPDDGVFT